MEHDSFNNSSPGSAFDSKEDLAGTSIFSPSQLLLLLSESLRKVKFPDSLPCLPTSPQNLYADALDDSLGVNPAGKPSTFDWLSPWRTTFNNIASSIPIIHLNEDEDANHDSGQELTSQDSEHVPDFEPPFVEKEDVDEIGEEDTLDPFWEDLISRAGTFEQACCLSG
ncbi:hypothetical protein R1flu_022757 [Riccia fluitans]|uniref:Uncharacterized protein n=1 Tax=Riccia fluitans TaxID=41844 RepID=A0ABD1XQM7_9MARC